MGVTRHLATLIDRDEEKEDPRLTWARIAAVGAVIVMGMWLGRVATGNEFIRDIVADYGFLGIFLVSLVSGFNIVVPVPAVAFVPVFLAAGQEFWAVIAVIVIGTTVADLTAFLLGKATRRLPSMRRTKIIRRMERFRERHYWWPLVIMFVYACIAPLPNEVLAIPLGMMGYPLLHVVLPLLAGNLVFNALAGAGLLAVFSAL